MGNNEYDMELHLKKGTSELVRDWREGASANDYRVTIHRVGTDLFGSFTKTQFNNLEDEAATSKAAFDAAAVTDMGIWSSMTAAERTDLYECFEDPGLRFLRVHKGSISYLSPTDIADSTISATELGDFNDAADVSESEFLDEVDASSIDAWFGGLTSGQRSDFASNFANR